MEVVAFIVGAFGLLFGLLCLYRLRSWEKQLAGARIAIAFKGKVKMDPSLLECMNWSRALMRDKHNNGRSFYKAGGTTVVILKPRPRYAKTKTRTIEEKQAA